MSAPLEGFRILKLSILNKENEWKELATNQFKSSPFLNYTHSFLDHLVTRRPSKPDYDTLLAFGGIGSEVASQILVVFVGI